MLNITNADKKQAIFKAWYICLAASLYPFYAFIQMNCLNVYSTPLLQKHDITINQLGILSAVYIYTDAIFLLPAGILLDRFTTRMLLLLCLILSVTGALLTAISQHFEVLVCARIIAGIGHSFALLGCFHLVARWFPPNKQGFLIGLIIMIALLGGLVAQSPIELLIQHYGFEVALWFNVVLGLIIGLIIWLVLPAETIIVSSQHKASIKLLTGLRQACRNRQNWLCGFYTCLLGLPLMLLGAVWGSSYLMATKQLTALQASWITTSIFLGTIIGSPLVGWISDKLQRRKLPMLVGAASCLFLLLFALYIPNLSIFSLVVFFFLLSICASSQVIGFPTIAESNPQENRSTAMGFSNVLIVAGIASFQLFFGILWSNKHFKSYAIWVLLIALIVSIFLALLIKETLDGKSFE